MKNLRLILVIGCLLGLCLSINLSQAESCECICVADSSCMQHPGCSGGDVTGCSMEEFTAKCSGTYTLRYDNSCSGTTCAKCYACAFLKDESGSVVSACHSDCQSGSCDGVCSGFTLTQGNSYKLYVCLRTCQEQTCENCSGGCVARAYLYRYDSDCPQFGTGCNP